MESDLRVNHSIDWLEVTSHKMNRPEELTPWVFDIGDELRPIPRYQKAFQTLPAGRLDISEDEKQGVHWTLLGQDWAAIRDAGISASGIVTHLSNYGATVSRLDFAVDIQGEADNPDKPRVSDVRLHIKNGWAGGLRHDTGYVPTEEEKGQTEYFGSKKADVRIRIYDKAAEMEMLWRAWVRVELQMRNKPATALMRDMAKEDVSIAGRTAIKQRLRMPFLWWFNAGLDGEFCELTKIPRPETNWQRWMRETVGSSVTKHMASDNDREFFIRWASNLLREAYAIDTIDAPLRRSISNLLDKH